MFITMNGITTVTTKGQVTIPGEVRRLLQVKVGDKVSFSEVIPEKKKAMIKIIPANIISSLAGSLSSKVKETDHKKVRSIVQKRLAKKYRIK